MIRVALKASAADRQTAFHSAHLDQQGRDSNHSSPPQMVEIRVLTYTDRMYVVVLEVLITMMTCNLNMMMRVALKASAANCQTAFHPARLDQASAHHPSAEPAHPELRPIDWEHRVGAALSKLSPELRRQHGLFLHRLRAARHVPPPPRVHRLHRRGVLRVQR